MNIIPGLGIARGMALTLRRFFAPRATIQVPEATPDVAVRFRGRLQLLVDEFGNLKCETCFQCAQACPVECIDMGGHDTRNRFWVHWGAPETYAERRQESALRRSGRPVPDADRRSFAPVEMGPLEEVLARRDYDPEPMLTLLEEIQAAYGYLPAAALLHVSHTTGAPFALLYGTATYYDHLSLEPRTRTVGICYCAACLLAGSARIEAAAEAVLGIPAGGGAGRGGEILERLPTHVPGAASPLVLVDGAAQAGVNARNAATWAQGLAGGGSAAKGSAAGKGAAGRGKGRS
jgi:NADH:ubiquinone oxidoreductase subunit E/NAD-dependent dihydropyrimidine dehydrogenase PreA subunit